MAGAALPLTAAGAYPHRPPKQSLYGLLRIFFHWDSFSGWPRFLYGVTLLVTIVSYVWMLGAREHVLPITECCS